jgi:maltooligosyltrehalose trehalohydrolase
LRYGAASAGAQGVEFRVWAPNAEKLELKLKSRVISMTRRGEDFEAFVPDAKPGDRYSFVLDGNRERPDPVSRSQPDGVHGASEIVAPESFHWSDQDWKGIDLVRYVLYELHTGTFTPQGTFDGVIDKLTHLQELGITAVELMPVAEFPGSRNWGYDGVDLYTPHSAYGGPSGLKRLVDACHRAGIAVVLDVVYNHLGPEGNYLAEFGPYFTDRYRTPWGQAINFDGPGSDGVRSFIIENALYWLTEYHIDALRLDAIHGIFDFGAVHLLAELRGRFHERAVELGRQAWIIAESDLNDVRVIRPRDCGGYALDAQWHDEFHHAMFALLTGSRAGFLGDFGRIDQLRKSITDGFVYDGAYSEFRRRHFGSSSVAEPACRFVTFIQNHDQVGNTAGGRRWTGVTSLDRHKLAVAVLLCAPSLPMLFMGEEFAETAPFFYFTSHGDPALAAAVTEGRRNEHAVFESAAPFPDPQAARTFEQSKITWSLLEKAAHRDMFLFYQQLIALRKKWPCLGNCRKDLTRVEVHAESAAFTLERGDPSGSRALLLCNFSPQPAAFRIASDPRWELALWTKGPPTTLAGSEISVPGHSAVLYLAQE